MADRIVVMRDGRTVQVGPPDVIYRDPQTPFVAGFIGTMNLIEGAVEEGRFVRAGFAVDAPVPDGPATLAVRPEALALRAAEPGRARVHRVTDYGSHGMVDVDLADGLRLKAMVPDPDHLRAGQGVDLAPSRVTLYRDDRRVWRT